MMDGNLNYFRDRMASDADYAVYLHQPDLRSLMLRKMEAFIRYLNGLIDDGRIDADIHLLRSAQDWARREVFPESREQALSMWRTWVRSWRYPNPFR